MIETVKKDKEVYAIIIRANYEGDQIFLLVKKIGCKLAA